MSGQSARDELEALLSQIATMPEEMRASSESFRSSVTSGWQHVLSGALSDSEWRAIAEELPADRFLVETDAPYLAPLPYRGKRNEPSYVVEVAKMLAEVRSV